MKQQTKPQNPLIKIATMVVLLLLVYFSYHAISGERGLLSLIKLTKQVEESQVKLDEVSAEKLQLEHHVELLRNESLDLDLLDEQARRTLGYVGKDETVYVQEE